MNDCTISAINQLKKASKIAEKKEIILENCHNQEFADVLFYGLHPFKTYKISKKTIEDPVPAPLHMDSVPSIRDMCQILSSCKALDNDMVSWVKSAVYSLPEQDREVYVDVLTKSLRIGMTAKSVNKIIKGFLPEWEVQQAYPIDSHPIKDGQWFSLSQKLNGVRATFYNGNIYARSGDAYEGLDHIISELNLIPGEYVLDGEITLLNPEGMSDNEAFRAAAGIVNSDSGDKTKLKITIFDIIPTDDFESDNPSMPYIERRALLDDINKSFSFQYVYVLPSLYSGTDQSVIEPLLDKMVREDKEGLVANLNVPYKRKRHSGILKIKRFYTMDLRICGTEEGEGRLSGTLGALVVDFKGSYVNVGSGFSDIQRSELWDNRDKIIGSLCEVKYKEVSCDKNTGAESLQFPVFVRIRNDKDTVSYG